MLAVHTVAARLRILLAELVTHRMHMSAYGCMSRRHPKRDTRTFFANEVRFDAYSYTASLHR